MVVVVVVKDFKRVLSPVSCEQWYIRQVKMVAVTYAPSTG